MLNYLKGTLNCGLFYPYGGVPMLMRYANDDWARNYTQGIQLRNLLFKLGECSGLIKLVST
jgi:hypothetical protein